MGIFGRLKKRPPQRTADLFFNAKQDFIDYCQKTAIKYAKRHNGLVTIDDVRRATIHNLPDYLNVNVYSHIFRGQFNKNFKKIGTRSNHHSSGGGHLITIWRLK